MKATVLAESSIIFYLNYNISVYILYYNIFIHTLWAPCVVPTLRLVQSASSSVWSQRLMGSGALLQTHGISGHRCCTSRPPQQTESLPWNQRKSTSLSSSQDIRRSQANSVTLTAGLSTVSRPPASQHRAPPGPCCRAPEITSKTFTFITILWILLLPAQSPSRALLSGTWNYK